MAVGGLNALAGIDWAAPWLADWVATGQSVAQPSQGDDHASVAEALNRVAGLQSTTVPVRFVTQDDLPQGMAYEAFIRGQGSVPTRDNLHDFFNGLAWLQAPLLKARLNQLQSDEIAQAGVRSTRGPVRDAVTVLDENGAFLCAPEPVWAALRAMDWRRLFVTLRPLWGECRLWLFGHALLEKLVSPRKPIVAHVCDLPLPASCLQATGWDELDPVIAGRLDATFLSNKPFCPLPVLGVPGWWPDNECTEFYDDAQVFRAPRPRLKPPAVRAS